MFPGGGLYFPFAMSDPIDSLEFKSMRFDWEPSQVTTNGLSLQGIDPGWFLDQQFSYAAYTIEDTVAATADTDQLPLEVKAHLRKSTGYETIEVSAVAAGSDVQLPDGFGTTYPGAEVFGTVAPANISFDKVGDSAIGNENYVPLELNVAAFVELGVGVYDVAWEWRYRTAESYNDEGPPNFYDDYHYLRHTFHRIFIICGQPRWPWTTWPSYMRLPNTHLPTFEAIELACNWAQGAKTVDEAAEKITTALFSSPHFSYKANAAYVKSYTNEEAALTPGHYSDMYFMFTEALSKINGGAGMGDFMNCEDCAHMVAALVNMLGGSLSVGYLYPLNDPDNEATSDRFWTNPFAAIGYQTYDESLASNDFNLTDSATGNQFFSYHAIAFKPTELLQDYAIANFTDPKIQVYDACLQFGDSDDSSDYQAVVHMPFGTCSDNEYRAKLGTTDPNGCGNIDPKQDSVLRTVII